MECKQCKNQITPIEEHSNFLIPLIWGVLFFSNISAWSQATFPVNFWHCIFFFIFGSVFVVTLTKHIKKAIFKSRCPICNMHIKISKTISKKNILAIILAIFFSFGIIGKFVDNENTSKSDQKTITEKTKSK